MSIPKLSRAWLAKYTILCTKVVNTNDVVYITICKPQGDNIMIGDYPKIDHFRELKSTKIHQNNTEIRCGDISFYSIWLLHHRYHILLMGLTGGNKENGRQNHNRISAWFVAGLMYHKGHRACALCQRCYFAYQIRLWSCKAFVIIMHKAAYCNTIWHIMMINIMILKSHRLNGRNDKSYHTIHTTCRNINTYKCTT